MPIILWPSSPNASWQLNIGSSGNSTLAPASTWVTHDENMWQLLSFTVMLCHQVFIFHTSSVICSPESLRGLLHLPYSQLHPIMTTLRPSQILENIVPSSNTSNMVVFQSPVELHSLWAGIQCNDGGGTGRVHGEARTTQGEDMRNTAFDRIDTRG